MLLRLFDDRRQVSASAVFHKNVQHARVAVDIAVIILHDMCMVKILQNIARCASGQALLVTVTKNADEHLGHNLLAIAFIHAFEIDLFPS
jgi:hypothetical protein